MLRRSPPPPPRLPPFRLHYPTHGNSSIPPPYEMAFPLPRPKRKARPFAFAAVVVATASVVLGTGLYGARQLANARAREQQQALVRAEQIAATRTLLGSLHDRFPVGLTEERPCDPGLRASARIPVLSFAQLPDKDKRSPAETALEPTSLAMTKEMVIDAPLVAVLMTNEASITPASYDGWLVVFDRNATPLCHARVVAKAGSASSFVDFKNQLRGAERAAAGRLSSNLTLEL